MARTLSQIMGKQILACLTEIDANGRIIRRQEFHGTLIGDEDRPLLQPRNNQPPFALPDNPDYYFPADPQRQYRLCSSDELVRGVDYTLTFIKAPPEYFQTEDHRSVS